MRTINKTKITFLTLVLMLIIPISVYGIDGQRKISQTPSTTFPIFISQSGSYVLTSNLVVTDSDLNAIEITVNDVMIDLNGHAIQGPNSGSETGHGIYANERYSITIKNGRVWGFTGKGINLTAAFTHHSAKGAGHRIEDMQVLNNGEGGIVLYGGGVIANCSVNNNGYIGLSALNSTLTNCTVNNNDSWGIEAHKSTVTHCTANHNSGHGIYSNVSTIRGCEVYANSGGSGIYGFGESYIVENNIRSNGSYGLYLPATNGYGYAIKNVVSGNAHGNFGISSGNYAPICGVDATDNCNYGF